MNKYILNLTLILLLLSCSFISHSQDKTDKSKQELMQGTTPNKPNSNNLHDSNSHNYEPNDQNILTNLATQIITYITYYALIGNYKNEMQLHHKVSKYPYYNNLTYGNYTANDSNSMSVLRIDVENNVLFNNNNLYGNHLKLKIRPFHYFYIQTDYIEIIEQNYENTYSNLSLFKFNFCYDRLRYERFNFGWSLGANYIANEVNMAGISLGLNTDIFITRKVSLYNAVSWCKINTIPVNDFEIYGRYHSGRFSTSIGYNFIKIATPEYHYASLGFGVYF